MTSPKTPGRLREERDGCEQVGMIITPIHLHGTAALCYEGAPERSPTFDKSPLKLAVVVDGGPPSLRMLPFIISLGAWARGRPEDSQGETLSSTKAKYFGDIIKVVYKSVKSGAFGIFFKPQSVESHGPLIIWKHILMY